MTVDVNVQFVHKSKNNSCINRLWQYPVDLCIYDPYFVSVEHCYMLLVKIASKFD